MQNSTPRIEPRNFIKPPKGTLSFQPQIATIRYNVLNNLFCQYQRAVRSYSHSVLKMGC